MDSIMKYKYPILIATLVVVAIIFAFFMHRRSMEHMDDMYSEYNHDNVDDNIIQQEEVQDFKVDSMKMNQNVYPDSSDLMGTSVDFQTGGGDVLPIDLLPKSQVSSEFEEDNGFTDLSARNFLVAGSAFGIDTQGSTNKLQNRDIRGDIPIPARLDTSPWNVSSYTGNPYARQMTIA